MEGRGGGLGESVGARSIGAGAGQGSWGLPDSGGEPTSARRGRATVEARKAPYAVPRGAFLQSSVGLCEPGR